MGFQKILKAQKKLSIPIIRISMKMLFVAVLFCVMHPIVPVIEFHPEWQQTQTLH